MNMNKPMSFRDFTKLSTDLQKQYLVHLRNTYNASTNDIAEMFGISKYSAGKTLHTLGITIPKGGTRTSAQRESWGGFIRGEERHTPVEEKNAEPVEETTITRSAQVLSGCFVYCGDLQSVCEKLMFMLGPDTMMERIEVHFVVAEGVSE